MPDMLIDYYKAIEDSSAKMLEAAKLKDWDGVVRHEGACAVLIDGKVARSCSVPLKAVDGKKVTTLEGLSPDASKAANAGQRG